MTRLPPVSTLFPYTTLFRSSMRLRPICGSRCPVPRAGGRPRPEAAAPGQYAFVIRPIHPERSEEHTSELQSRGHLVCRLLLEKKKKIYQILLEDDVLHLLHI